jgi:hypothetical protein
MKSRLEDSSDKWLTGLQEAMFTHERDAPCHPGLKYQQFYS